MIYFIILFYLSFQASKQSPHSSYARSFFVLLYAIFYGNCIVFQKKSYLCTEMSDTHEYWTSMEWRLIDYLTISLYGYRIRYLVESNCEGEDYYRNDNCPQADEERRNFTYHIPHLLTTLPWSITTIWSAFFTVLRRWANILCRNICKSFASRLCHIVSYHVDVWFLFSSFEKIWIYILFFWLRPAPVPWYLLLAVLNLYRIVRDTLLVDSPSYTISFILPKWAIMWLSLVPNKS